MKKNLLSGFLLLLPVFLLADSLVKLDSLQKQLSVAKGIEKAKVYLKLSDATRNVSFTDCINYGLKAAAIAHKEKDYDIEGLAYKAMGVSCFYSGDLQRAYDYYTQGLASYEKSENKQGMSNCFNNIGLLYEDWSRFDSAYYFYQKSFQLEEELNNKQGMALSLINLGNIGYYRKNYQQALDHYYRAMLLFKETGDDDGEAKAFNSLGVIYWNWGKPEEALKYLKNAEEIYLKIKKYRGLSQVYTNIAEIYSQIYKEYKTAMNYYEKSLVLKKKLDDQEGIALLYNDIGSLYGNMEDIEKANMYFQKSFLIYDEVNSKKGKTLVLYNKGKVCQQEKKYRQAISNFQKSLTLGEKINYKELVQNSYEGLFRSFVGINKPDSFEYYYGLYAAGLDSLTDQLQEAQIAGIEAKYKAQELLKENQNIHKENERKEKNIKRYRLILTGIIGAIILLLFTYVLFFKVHKNDE